MAPSIVNRKRVQIIKDGSAINGPVIYAMSRDQRVEDNWALIYAQELAVEKRQPLIVACPIAADYPDASIRQIAFMTAGLTEVERRLMALNIRFIVSDNPPAESIYALADATRAGGIVCDFNPLRESRTWKSQLSGRLNIPIFEVDAHNIMPCWEASDKLEYAAYTIRPKINRKLSEFLTSIPRLKKHPVAFADVQIPTVWSNISEVASRTRKNNTVALVEPGAKAANLLLQAFLTKKLGDYNDLRNDPNASAQSNLSPYLHFGQLSTQRVALETQRFDADIASQEAFLEELIVRRELADNFCFCNDRYDTFDGFPAWAQKTLHDHRPDPRPYLYDKETLEAAATHDELWNAAQTEMVATGKMHGYLRMYWAKKILEWTISPEEALAQAIYLNDTYELDGRDPNGYAGIAWSIGGTHDRAWSEREIFGKIRYMSLGGCNRKFDTAAYARQVASLASGVSA